MSRFNPHLHRLARARLRHWQGVVQTALEKQTQTEHALLECRQINKWFRVSYSYVHDTMRSVTVTVGLPARRRRVDFYFERRRFASGYTAWKILCRRSLVTRVAVSAAVHEAWDALHGNSNH